MELTRVLTSRVFERAKRSQRFLSYLVEGALHDPPVTFKEFTLAIDVFDRPTTYDPSIDATVRVEASRLRSRLREYYLEDGRDNPWMIEIPKGEYSVRLRPRIPTEQQTATPAMARSAHHEGPLEQTAEYLETLPGGRANVNGLVETDARLNGSSHSQPLSPSSRRPLLHGAFFRLSLIAVAIALLISIGLTALKLATRNDVYSVANLRSITTLPGSALHPSYSPDGHQVVFSWDGEGGPSIYVIVPQSDHPVRLTHSALGDDYPTWSPDGKHIAFLRLSSRREGYLMLISALGGTERTLLPLDFTLETSSASSYLAWTPDSKWICFSARPEKSKSFVKLRLLSPETGEWHPLFATADERTSDASPAFSPDGRWLTFLRFSFGYNTTLLLQPLAPGWQPDGDPIPVRGAGQNPIASVWAQDSRSLFFLDRTPSRLLEAEVSDVKASRPAHQIYAAAARLEGLSFTGPEARLATSTFSEGTDLWAMSLKKDFSVTGVPQKVFESKATQYHPEFSPDGRWVAFVSARDGSLQVWICAPNGDHLRQLTYLENYILGFPSWSPDGQYIAFHARVPTDAELFVVRVVDGALRQVTRGPNISEPSWSRDGRFLYGFGAYKGSQFLFRVSVSNGKRELLWEGIQPQEMPDRRLLVYTKMSQPGIFARKLSERGAAEPEQRLVSDYSFGGGRALVPVSEGFYYPARDSTGQPRGFRFYSFDSKTAVDVAPAPGNLSLGLAVSPDRTKLVYGAEKSNEADLISLELKKERR